MVTEGEVWRALGGGGAVEADVHVRFDGVCARPAGGGAGVRDVVLDVHRGELLALLGPPGCGAGTLLRTVTRLVEPTAGRVLVDDRDTRGTDPVRLRRATGHVTGTGGLQPHRTVRHDVATVPRLLGWDESTTRTRVDGVLRLLGVDPAAHGDRYPAQLDEEQRRRVALARALAAAPPLLLLDDPFRDLDPAGRAALRADVRRLQRDLGTTVLLATPDLDEALATADRVAVLLDGELHQVADPATLLAEPATGAVADLLGPDRGLDRLAVTPLRTEDLAVPAVFSPRDGAGYAATALEVDGRTWALVLDDRRRLLGWVPRGALARAARRGERGNRVGDHVLPVEATAQRTETLRVAFSRLLAQQQRFLPVLDGEEFLGVLTPDAVLTALRREAPPAAVPTGRHAAG